MKVSEITTQAVADFLRIDDTRELPFLQAILDAAVAYCKDTCNLSVEKLDEHADITLAVLVLCQDMYDNRSMYVDKGNANRVVTAILHMYRQNFV